MNTKVIPLFLSLIAFHAAHVFEEVWGRFFLMNVVFGMGWYLFANWFVFCIPLVIFYFIYLKKKTGYRIGIIYATIMIMNGIGHNLATIITGKYFDGYAGGFTGIGLVITGIPLLISFRKEIQNIF